MAEAMRKSGMPTARPTMRPRCEWAELEDGLDDAVAPTVATETRVIVEAMPLLPVVMAPDVMVETGEWPCEAIPLDVGAMDVLLRGAFVLMLANTKMVLLAIEGCAEVEGRAEVVSCAAVVGCAEVVG